MKNDVVMIYEKIVLKNDKIMCSNELVLGLILCFYSLFLSLC